MIRASYCRDEARLTVTGHAGSAAHGHDLVCAAASALVYTLAFNVQKLERAGLCGDADVKLLPGDAQIRCAPLPGQQQAVTAVFDALWEGFVLLARQFPAFVQLSGDRETAPRAL